MSAGAHVLHCVKTYYSLTVDVRFQHSLSVVEIQLEIAVVDVVRRGKQQTVTSRPEAHGDVIGVRHHQRVYVDVSVRPAVVRQYWRHCAHTHTTRHYRNVRDKALKECQPSSRLINVKQSEKILGPDFQNILRLS